MHKEFDTFGTIRELNQGDLKMVLDWRNSERVRQSMLHDGVISWESHVQWYEKMILDRSQRYFLFSAHDHPKGMIYFQNLSEGPCDWGFYIGVEEPRKKWGTQMAIVGLNWAMEEYGVDEVLAVVKSSNDPSLRFHERIGFMRYEPSEVTTASYEKKFPNAKDKLIFYRLPKSRWLQKRIELVNNIFEQGRAD